MAVLSEGHYAHEAAPLGAGDDGTGRITMAGELQTIEKTLTSDLSMRKLMIALGQNATEADAREYAGGILNEVRRSAGQEYGDLTTCSPDSIIQAMVDRSEERR